MCLSSKPVSVEVKKKKKSYSWAHNGYQNDVEEWAQLTWWVECDDTLQEGLQLRLQAAEADAASLFQGH